MLFESTLHCNDEEIVVSQDQDSQDTRPLTIWSQTRVKLVLTKMWLLGNTWCRETLPARRPAPDWVLCCTQVAEPLADITTFIKTNIKNRHNYDSKYRIVMYSKLVKIKWRSSNIGSVVANVVYTFITIINNRNRLESIQIDHKQSLREVLKEMEI